MAKLARLPELDRSDGMPAGSRRTPRLRTRFYAFLSYSHKDKELADWLHRELERFRVPATLAGKLTANGVVPRRLMPIFRDQQDLSAGPDLAEEIKAALAASQFLVVLCSPTAATSRWTNAEIESFKRTRPEGCVLAAVAAGEPFASEIPGREDEECFPPALRFKYDRRGHQTAKRAEPLAADFRENHDGRKLAFLKLVAGMLGVGLDELVKREQSRRHRQLAWLAAGSLAGMAVTSTLAIAAFQARNEAREQRREAESLVEFMVGDLRAKLEPIGKLDVLDGVGSRVLSYYRKQDTSELTDDALLQRSKALNLMGEVAFDRAHLDEAESLYRQAMAGTAEAVRRSPNDTKRLYEQAQNVFWLGEIARFRGRNDQAETKYREYKRLADRLVALEPDNIRWRMESLYGSEDVGIALYNERRFGEAAGQFGNALVPMQTLASIDASSPTNQIELSKVFAWLADAQRAQGNFQAAIALRTRQVSLLNQAVEHGAVDVGLREQLIPAQQGLGVLLAAHGQAERGAEELQAAVTQADQLIPIEPANGFWKGLSAGARLDLARILLALDRPADAEKLTNAGCTIVDSLRTSGPTLPRETICALMRTRLALSANDKARALASAERTLRLAQAESNAEPITDRIHVPMAYRLLGDARLAAGDAQGARDAWSRAFGALIRGAAEIPSEMDEHAVILERLGRTAEAQRLAARLNAMGYRRLM